MTVEEFAARWIAEHIDEFQEKKRLEKLRTLKLRDLTSRKNPYLFRVKGMETSEQIIRSFLDAALSSSEETSDMAIPIAPRCSSMPPFPPARRPLSATGWSN